MTNTYTVDHLVDRLWNAVLTRSVRTETAIEIALDEQGDRGSLAAAILARRGRAQEAFERAQVCDQCETMQPEMFIATYPWGESIFCRECLDEEVQADEVFRA